MPDLLTHMAVSHLVRRPFELKRQDNDNIPMRILFYLGTILPDILTRPWYILFPVTREWTYPLHTPFGMLLVCTMTALFFEPAIRKRAWINLIAGSGIHFVLDATQTHLTYTEHWLYPFSWKGFGFHIMRAEDYLLIIPVWLIVIVIMEICIHVMKRYGSHKERPARLRRESHEEKI